MILSRFFAIFGWVFFTKICYSLDPLITSWIKCNGTGSGNGTGILANVQVIAYSSNYVYIRSSSVPTYSIGPWTSNPNQAGDQKKYFMFPRTPTIATRKTSTGLGSIGVLINGVQLYNCEDGMSYNNLGVWKRNALVYEGLSFDECNGHPDQSSTYHNHLDPKCLYTKNPSQHSPLIGWMLDGYPLYGPYGYSSPMNSSSSIKRMLTGYSLRTDMAGVRHSLPNGTVLASQYYGPDVNATYPLGNYLADFVWSAGSDLDIYNGRLCVTPDFPNGTYAYFISIDSSGNGVYPLIMGPEYYGVPALINVMTSGGGGNGMRPGPPGGTTGAQPDATSTTITVKNFASTYNATIYFCYAECSRSSHLSFSSFLILLITSTLIF